LVRATLIVGKRGLKRSYSSEGGEETYIWREFYTEKFHKTHRIKLAVSVAQYVEIYVSNECLFGSLTGIKYFGSIADVKGFCE